MGRKELVVYTNQHSFYPSGHHTRAKPSGWCPWGCECRYSLKQAMESHKPICTLRNYVRCQNRHCASFLALAGSVEMREEGTNTFYIHKRPWGRGLHIYGSTVQAGCKLKNQRYLQIEEHILPAVRDGPA